MIAVYWLWRMEREARDATGIRLLTAAIFGLCAGLGMLTKATSGVLPMALAIFVLWRSYEELNGGNDLSLAWKSFLLPAAVSGLVWCLVAGWWVAPNLLKYGHPFPHPWDLSPPPNVPEMLQPAMYRRPLGWALPFYWRHYLSEPMLENYLYPTPNLWAQFVTGTWTDLINRGFCRVQGEGVFTKYFDGWPVSGRCIRVLSWMAHIGLFTTVIMLGCLFRTFCNSLRSVGQKGSFVLPLIAFLVVFFTSMFTLAYPVDGMVTTNPRYLLPASIPIAACLAIGLSEIEQPVIRRVLMSLMGAVATVVAVLVIYQRVG
jgi:hypothetical protein